jgi:uracil-DNA glycosylase
MTRPRALAVVQRQIAGCNRCPRLRSYCREVGRVKRAAYRADTYWARPVPGFGDPQARVLVLGLAPAAHGANRTGRVFTGDGTGGSGDFLMAALHRAGLANIATSHRADDGLVLKDVYIAAAVRCAPPANKPTPEEIDTCLDHLEAEVAALPRLQAVVALGKIAWDAWLKLAARQGVAVPRPRPVFSHGAVCTLGTLGTHPLGTRGTVRTIGTLIGCYHPSRQNTNTGTVTPAMYDAVFQRALKPFTSR